MTTYLWDTTLEAWFSVAPPMLPAAALTWGGNKPVTAGSGGDTR
jgi:hypothetical protein